MHGVELWRSDGTEGGTRMIHDLVEGPLSSHVGEMTVVGNKLFFWADDNLHGRELWVLIP